MSNVFVKEGRIVNAKGKEIILKGINFGGWLLMEGYILGGRNIPESEFKKNFSRIYGVEELKRFEHAFRKNFITHQDFMKVKKWGFNCVRIPFHYKIFEEKPFKYKDEGIKILDWIVKMAKKFKIFIILDMHAVCGSQNGDWHSDSKGEALFWKSRDYQERFVRLWEFIADYLKGKDFIAGFDLMNEPVITKKTRRKLLLHIYKKTITKILKIDKYRIFFVEPNLWAQDAESIKDLKTPNTVLSVHFYLPLSFVFNFVKGLRYPGRIEGDFWNKKKLEEIFIKYVRFSQKMNVPLHVGEFGINFRSPQFYGECKYLEDLLSIFSKYRVHYNYWTYKGVPLGVYPDGILQLLDNLSWIARHSSLWGWENFYSMWKNSKNKIISSLRSENFKENIWILNVLRKFL